MSPENTPTTDAALVEAQAQTWVKLLFDVSSEFASSLDLDKVLGHVLSMTIKVVQASEGSIFLLDSKGAVIRSIIAREELPPEVKVPTIETVMQKGFAGWLYENKETVFVADTKEDTRWVDFPEDRLKTRSAVGIPILREEDVIGIMTLTHPNPSQFPKALINVLQPITQLAAQAIENAALYTKTKQERQALRTVIQSAWAPILVLDANDKLMMYNKSAREVLGVQDLYLGKSLSEFLKSPDLAEFAERSFDEKPAFKEIKFDDGRVFDCSGTEVPTLGKMISLHNITTLKELDALKSEFVSHVSHDLKNPLAIIGGYASMLLDAAGEPETIVDFADKISKAVDRMRDLIENILDIGKIELGIESEFTAVNIGDLIAKVADDMAPVASQKNIKLVTELQAKLPEVHGAPIRMGQAVANLVGNALKFTPEQGTVTIGATAEDNALTVWVQDTGPGIPPALQEKLFQKFTKLGQDATAQNEGHGLGLAIVKAVVDAHDGRVGVESTEGEGTRFYFSLPVE